uniref:Uncharacterized protein n=1 Tax=Avena sativa TaxID=4498 RepID=A0ACD5TS97_AVESA
MNTCPDPGGGRDYCVVDPSSSPGNPRVNDIYCSELSAPWSDLESLFGHFWSSFSASPNRVGGDSFGWWEGKVAGDPRSFAQVAASSAMKEGGGRFGGQGNFALNQGRGRLVWNREDAQASSSIGPHGSGSGDRWEIAARESEQRRQEAASQVDVSGKNNSSGSPAVVSDSICSNCKIKGHIVVLCPTARCERCKKLGHVSHVCQAVLPWECITQMCAFQSPSMGFFYIPDSSTSKQNKERSSSVVISVIEGQATARELEMEFNIVFGDSWRCTARPIGPNQYIMRFPNPREVERAVYYGASMRLKTIDATMRLSTWTASVGAKAILQKAWVRISNIPLDKRTDSIVFYVGSLVGVSLDLDASTLHKPEFVRVLIGCRDVDLLPAKAEGCLGDNFYDFFFEIDKVVVGGPPKQSSKIPVGGNSAPSPKRARMDQSLTATSTATDEASGEQFFGSQTDSVRQHGVQDVEEKRLENEQISDDDIITDVSVVASSPSKDPPSYTVQSPDSASMEEVVVIEDAERFSQRLQAEANVHVMEKVANVSKKRTLEGNEHFNSDPLIGNSFAALSDSDIVTRASMMGVKIPDNDFSSINLLRELEHARNGLLEKNEPNIIHQQLFIENNTGVSTPLSMAWANSSDVDDSSFTLVESRKKRVQKGNLQWGLLDP